MPKKLKIFIKFMLTCVKINLKAKRKWLREQREHCIGLTSPCYTYFSDTHFFLVSELMKCLSISEAVINDRDVWPKSVGSKAVKTSSIELSSPFQSDTRLGLTNKICRRWVGDIFYLFLFFSNFLDFRCIGTICVLFPHMNGELDEH